MVSIIFYVQPYLGKRIPIWRANFSNWVKTTNKEFFEPPKRVGVCSCWGLKLVKRGQLGKVREFSIAFLSMGLDVSFRGYNLVDFRLPGSDPNLLNLQILVKLCWFDFSRTLYTSIWFHYGTHGERYDPLESLNFKFAKQRFVQTLGLWSMFVFFRNISTANNHKHLSQQLSRVDLCLETNSYLLLVNP